MSTPTSINGKPRKQLSDQLDRLDNILDAIGEGLPEAVADACREGARQAVKDAIVEVLTNPELRELLAPPVLPPAPVPPASPEPTGPGLWSRIKARVASVPKAVTGVVTKAKEAILRRCMIAGEMVVALGRATGETLPVRRVVLAGLGVGLAVGVTCLAVPQTAAAVISGIGAACTAVSVQVGSWLRRGAGRIGLV